MRYLLSHCILLSLPLSLCLSLAVNTESGKIMKKRQQTVAAATTTITSGTLGSVQNKSRAVLICLTVVRVTFVEPRTTQLLCARARLFCLYLFTIFFEFTRSWLWFINFYAFKRTLNNHKFNWKWQTHQKEEREKNERERNTHIYMCWCSVHIHMKMKPVDE